MGQESRDTFRVRVTPGWMEGGDWTGDTGISDLQLAGGRTEDLECNTLSQNTRSEHQGNTGVPPKLVHNPNC